MMDVGLALVVCILMASRTAVQSQIRKGPANALKRAGDSVTLECVTSSNNCDQVDWFKVEGLQSPRLVFRNRHGMLNNDLFPFQRYSVNSTGGCSLTITQLEIRDSGRFICMHSVDYEEYSKTSILIVINVTESCLSNVTSNALAKDDGYSLWCAIKVPSMFVEPSNVALVFLNKAVGERETTNRMQPQSAKITLIGTANQENITPRLCRASFAPHTYSNYDNTVAFLDVCTTQQFIVSYPVEEIPVSPSLS